MTTAVRYSAEVVRRCQQMARAGGWPEADPQVGTGVVGSLEAGTLVRLQVRIDADVVADARFKAFGCSAAIASASLAADLVAGRPRAAALTLDAAAVADALDLPEDKRAMAAHAVAAVRQAIGDWESKAGARDSGLGRDSGWRNDRNH